MRAAYITAPGAPEAITCGDLPKPVPRGNEVLVKVAAAAVNPIDTYIRSGIVAMNLPKPYIVGCDLAGTVEETGPLALRFQPGDRVWGSNQGLLGRQGTFAEYACVSEDWLYYIPDNVGFEQAAAGALTGITAHLGLFRCARLSGGETVFVSGGTGGVGQMVVQMAKAANARVITTVGSIEKGKLCRKWGADLVLLYKSEDVVAAVENFTQGEGVHVWFETLREPDFGRIIPLMAKRGRVVVMAGRQATPPFPVGPFYTKDLTLLGFAMFNATPEEQRSCAEDMNYWYALSWLQPCIGRTFRLTEAAQAHQLQEDNTLKKAGTLTGKIIVVP
jgi:NADPH2:quinone reductase